MNKTRRGYTRRILVLYDAVIIALVEIFMLIIYKGNDALQIKDVVEHGIFAMVTQIGRAHV